MKLIGASWVRFAVGTALLLLQATTDAHAEVKTPNIGYVENYDAAPDRLESLKKGLLDLGLREGENIRIEYRTARLDDQYFDVISQFVALKVDIILAANAPAALAAARTTQTIPIVMAAVNDPVGLGIVKTLESPGTNVTGTTNYAPHLIAERLKLLQRMVPGLMRVGMFLNRNNPNNEAQFQELTGEATRLGLRTDAYDIQKPTDVSLRFAEARRNRVGAMLNAVDSFVNSQRFEIAKLSAENRLPFLYSDYEYVTAGGLMSLGPGHNEGYYGAAKYVDAILKGAKPADLPIVGPTRFTLTVSKTALEKLRLKLPDDVAARVDEWLP